MTTEPLWRCWLRWLYLSLVLVNATTSANVDVAMINSNVAGTDCQYFPTPAPAPKTETMSSRGGAAPSTAQPCTGEDADAAATETSTTSATTLVDKLRERMVRLTDELNRAQAVVAVERHREQMLALLEKSKYCYVNTATDKVSKLVGNLEHVERVLLGREQQRNRLQQFSRTERTQCQPGRRIQLIRRLLTGAEVGLVHMDSVRKLQTGSESGSTANGNKNVGCGRERRTNSY